MDPIKNTPFTLIYPLDVECLRVYPRDSDVNGFSGQLADFSMLPHRGNSKECLPPRLTPNISEDLVSKPFETTSYPLEAGVHLHWSLPKALRTASVKESNTGEGGAPEMEYRAVPNRWMIQRLVFIKVKTENPKEEKTEPMPEGTKTFIIHSDLLSTGDPGGSNAFPYKPENFKSGDPLYRYVGKCWHFQEYEKWMNEGANREDVYLENLTAFGYGEPLYAAYYPECKNVFGFHDDLYGGDIVSKPIFDLKKAVSNYEIRYQIIGWYSDIDKDPTILKSVKDLREGDEVFEGGELVETYHIELQSKDGFLFNWNIDQRKEDFVDPKEVQANPDSANSRLLFAREIAGIDWSRKTPETEEEKIDAKAKEEAKKKKEEAKKNIKIAIGNTPGQAYSALLANLVGKDKEEVLSRELMLDALQQGLLNQTDQVDLVAKIDRGMHQSGFSPVEGGAVWKINVKAPPQEKGKTTAGDVVVATDNQISDWNKALNKLNDDQKQYDDLRFDIEGAQIQLYADWYKFMIAEYNLKLGEITKRSQVNEIRAYLTAQMSDLYEKFKKREDLKTDIEGQIEELQDALAYWFATGQKPQQIYELERKAAARYWEPAEPAILFFGGEIEHSDRYHSDKKSPVSLSGKLSLPTVDHDMPSSIKILLKGDFFSKNGYLSTIHKENWSPLYLDWQVKLYPISKPYDIDNEEMPWQENSILKKFELEFDELDLSKKKAGADDGPTKYIDHFIKKDSTGILQTVEGRSILSPNAHLGMIQGIKDALGSQSDTDGLIDKLNEVKVLAQNLSGLNDVYLMRKQVLQLSVFDPLADNQLLDNFTNKLLRSLIGNGNTTAPLPANLFLPIREGFMKIGRLSLVDSFGRRVLWDLEDHVAGLNNDGEPDIIIAENLKCPPLDSISEENDQKAKSEDFYKNAAFLPPRISQPSRLSVNLLPFGESSNAISENNIGFNPVCGWVLPNFLDSTLYVYDADGHAKGVLQVHGTEDEIGAVQWLPVPGFEETEIDSLSPQLKKMVKFLTENPKNNFDEMIQVTFDSLQNIEPSNYEHFSGTAMLMGKPLALVQASISLELKSSPVKDQGWDSRLDEYLAKPVELARDPHLGFTKAKFPLRLGDISQSNDGLVGYFLTSINGKKTHQNAEFYSWFCKDELMVNSEQTLAMEKHYMEEDKTLKIQKARDKSYDFIKEHLGAGERNTGPGIFRCPLETDISLTCNPKESYLEVLMLLDPRAKVHITTGILPENALEIPSTAIAEAIKNIRMTFLTAPILSPADQKLIPLLQEEGVSWSWVEHQGADWPESTQSEITSPPEQMINIPSKLTLREGWLKLIK